MDDKGKAIWFGIAVPLSWLFEMDNCTAPGGLAGAFGDRFLCHNNPVYSTLRREALGYGYRFSSEDTSLWRDYQSFSLVTLQRIVSMKTIPYLDTASTIGRLLEANPAARLAPGFIVNNLSHNHAFHESAHCVAHSLLHEIEGAGECPSERDRFVLDAILAESFANTVEVLAYEFQRDNMADALFYSLNSYLAPRPERKEVLANAEREFGWTMRFELLYWSFLRANLSGSRPRGDEDYAAICAASGCPSEPAELVRQTIDLGLALSKGFRADTTPNWFGLIGYLPEYQALAGAAWTEESPVLEFVRNVVPQLAAKSAGAASS